MKKILYFIILASVLQLSSYTFRQHLTNFEQNYRAEIKKIFDSDQSVVEKLNKVKQTSDKYYENYIGKIIKKGDKYITEPNQTYSKDNGYNAFKRLLLIDHESADLFVKPGFKARIKEFINKIISKTTDTRSGSIKNAKGEAREFYKGSLAIKGLNKITKQINNYEKEISKRLTRAEEVFKDYQTTRYVNPLNAYRNQIRKYEELVKAEYKYITGVDLVPGLNGRIDIPKNINIEGLGRFNTTLSKLGDKLRDFYSKADAAIAQHSEVGVKPPVDGNGDYGDKDGNGSDNTRPEIDVA